MAGSMIATSPRPTTYVLVPAPVIRPALGATTIIPGHGPVWHDTAYLDLVSSALSYVQTQARAAVAKHTSLEDARKQIDLSEFQKKFCGADHDREIAFKMGFTDQVIERAFEEAKFAAED